MSALDDIRDGLKTALAGVTGLKAYARAPGEVSAPAAVIAPDSIEYTTDFDGGATYRLPVLFLVPLGDWARAQEVMDGYVAHDGTAVAAIHAADIETRITGLEQYGVIAYGLTDYLGAQLIVEVIV